MALEQKINEGIKAAMLAKDKVRLDALRAVKTAILVVKTSGSAADFDEAAEIKMLQKLVKQRRESAEIYLQNKRDELAEKEISEANIIEEFLPKQLTELEIVVLVKQVIESSGATSAKEMGKVMGIASKELAGRADGHLISKVVKELLA